MKVIIAGASGMVGRLIIKEALAKVGLSGAGKEVLENKDILNVLE